MFKCKLYFYKLYHHPCVLLVYSTHSDVFLANYNLSTELIAQWPLMYVPLHLAVVGACSIQLDQLFLSF